MSSLKLEAFRPDLFRIILKRPVTLAPPLSWVGSSATYQEHVVSYVVTDPRSDAHDCCRVLHRIRDQSGAVPSISTIATYPVSLIALIPDP